VAEDVTEEMVERARGILEGWYSEGRTDWSDVWDRMERQGPLEDGTFLDLGEDLASPALKRIKREVRQ
jgi:hypothetical protein